MFHFPPRSFQTTRYVAEYTTPSICDVINAADLMLAFKCEVLRKDYSLDKIQVSRRGCKKCRGVSSKHPSRHLSLSMRFEGESGTYKCDAYFNIHAYLPTLKPCRFPVRINFNLS